MKSIDKIHIENVRGIENETFQISLIPFMPTFLVAPNGFGKSSIAIAFNSLNRDRLKLDAKNSHLGEISREPLLEIYFTQKDNSKVKLSATKDINEISKVFQVEVIKSLLKPEANLKNFKGIQTTSPTIEIESIYIIEDIPEKFELPYQVSKFKNSINDNRQIWTDISDLLKNRIFINKLESIDILSKFHLVKQTTLIENFIGTVKSIQKNKEEILNELNATQLSILNNEFFNKLVELIEQFKKNTKAESILIAIQVVQLYKTNSEEFKKLFVYKRYCTQKERILKLFKAFKATWKGITPTEINITKRSKGKTVLVQKNFGIEFPIAIDISNGERDVVCFIGSLLKAQLNFKGKPTILIIDEVFDYLDDANLIAVQYYITKFIEYYQSTKDKVSFFPIILTHLNPYYFKNYFFSNQKIFYLSNWKGQVDRGVEAFVISRNNSVNRTYTDNVSGYFLHFHTDYFDITAEATTEFTTQRLNNLNPLLCKSDEFKKHISVYFDNYIKGKKNYDPISVCIATRILIEEKTYSMITDVGLQRQFIDTNTTVAKLNLIKENTDIVIPEIYYFLGTLYNELLHLRKNNDNSSPIFLKLNNLTIRRMINELTK